MAKRESGNPAIIVSNEPSAWMSCRIITPNLERAYRGVFGKTTNYFSYTDRMTDVDIWPLARKIHDSKPDRLVFLDHAPHPEKLLIALSQVYGTRPLPPLYVHLYGDFTLYTSHWLRLEELLKRTQVKFICASHREIAMVKRFLSSSSDEVERCPFPVDSAIYRYSPELRRQWRGRLGLKDGEVAILYTGRLSLQKNIVRLTREIAAFARLTGTAARFYIAGNFDDLGAPFFGIHLPRGYYFQHWQKVVDTQLANLKSRIHYLGTVGPDVLSGLYNAADVYASLSLHHDEDYGMSPAEALCCGTPVVLSDWGGYASFASDPRSCKLAGVRITNRGLAISSAEFQKGLVVQSMLGHQDNGRAERSKHYQDDLSIEAAVRRITAFHAQEPGQFTGFNWLMRMHAENFSKVIPLPEGPRKNTFYEEIYGAYINTQS